MLQYTNSFISIDFHMTISLIIPCYNEEANLQKGVLDKIGNFTKNRDEITEILIVDDGSTDSSPRFIKEKYLNLFPKFKLIENQHIGKAFSIITGMRQSTAEYVIFSDIDLATPIEELDKLIAELHKGYDIVIGSRKAGRQGAPLTRKILAKGFIIIRDIFISLNGIKDTQCGFKAFKKSLAIEIINQLRVFHNRPKVSGPSVSAGFDLEFLFLATKLNYKIREIAVTWRHVETKNVNFVKDSIETLRDILKIKYYDLVGAYKK